MMHFGDPRLPDRFWSKVIPEPMSGCWLWIGAINGDRGYGNLMLNGKATRAHRISFLVENEIPDGLVVDHKCRVRCCVNPAHLRAITFKENVLIGLSSSAINARKTRCPMGHELSGGNLYVHARGDRGCLECKRASNRRSMAKIRANKMVAKEARR